MTEFLILAAILAGGVFVLAAAIEPFTRAPLSLGHRLSVSVDVVGFIGVLLIAFHVGAR